MIQEITLSGVADRLHVLENEVRTIHTLLEPQTESQHIEFVIQADGKDVWSGTDLLRHYPEISREYPDAHISIGWRSAPIVLV